jgi:hypothetical protein
VRRSFMVHGKPIPPEIFRDFGDADMADSGSIWVTVDVAAATGSNLYYDPIKQDGGFVAQTKTDPKTNAWDARPTTSSARPTTGSSSWSPATVAAAPASS